MPDRHLQISDPLEAVLGEVRRRLESGRAGNFVAELGGPELGFALYWGRLQEGSPGTPPDERYLLDEVRPAGLSAEAAIDWELVPGGRTEVVAWNVAEAIDRTHLLPAGTVVLVREELDRSSPAEFRAIFFHSAGGGGRDSCMCRVTGYDSGGYTVQPVTWSEGDWADDGEPLSGIVNVGEVQDGEAGYLSGPSGHDIYARLYDEGGEKFLAVHPPRLP